MRLHDWVPAEENVILYWKNQQACLCIRKFKLHKCVKHHCNVCSMLHACTYAIQQARNTRTTSYIQQCEIVYRYSSSCCKIIAVVFWPFGLSHQPRNNFITSGLSSAFSRNSAADLQYFLTCNRKQIHALQHVDSSYHANPRLKFIKGQESESYQIYIYLFIDPFSEFIPELPSIIVAVRDQTICMDKTSLITRQCKF